LNVSYIYKMKEIYRITKGVLTSESYNFPFYFGIISQENGLLYFDLYVEKQIDLNVIIDQENSEYSDDVYHMESLTEDKNKVTAKDLWIRRVDVQKSKITLISRNYLLHSEIEEEYFKPVSSRDNENRRQVLYYLELEGLKMKFLNITQTVKTRNGFIINEYNNNWNRVEIPIKLTTLNRSKLTTYFTGEEIEFMACIG